MSAGNDGSRLKVERAPPPQHPRSNSSRHGHSSRSHSHNSRRHHQRPITSSDSRRVTEWAPKKESSYKRDEQLYGEVGKGTYGSVYVSRDTDGSRVALKKILLSEKNKEGFPITAIREIKILKQLKHPNVVNLKEVVSSHVHTPGKEKEGNVFMVFEFCDHDLTGLMETQKLQPNQVKYYMKCILEGLEYCHRNYILHRDIKGANILISNNGDVKLADFGLARAIPRVSGRQANYTNRVVTLWYRAPELLLGMKNYSAKIDLWSVGCLFAEMLTGGTILFDGKGDMEQIQKIYEMCGTPVESEWKEVKDLDNYKKFPPKVNKPRKLREYFRRMPLPPDAVDLLDKLLALNPADRLSAGQALDHNYFLNENPPPMQKDQHPKYKGHMFELGCKKRKRNRQQAYEQALRNNKGQRTGRGRGGGRGRGRGGGSWRPHRGGGRGRGGRGGRY